MLNHGYTYRDTISSADAGRTLLEFYAGRYRHSTAEEWRGHIAAGRILRNGEPVRDAEFPLRSGDQLAWQRPPWEEQAVPTHIPVLAVSDGWLVLHKPSGLPVMPGGGFLQHTLLHIARERHGSSLAPVHRLGRGTSGAILFSRDAATARLLARAMREGSIRKTYLALVAGLPEADAFTVDVPIGPVAYAPFGMLHAASPDGKASRSIFRVLHRDAVAGTALLAVDIPTGRPHQIRIHCAAAGYPLLGDPLYRVGGVPGERNAVPGERNAVPGDGGYLLHSWMLRLCDPDSGAFRTVVAPPPAALAPTASAADRYSAEDRCGMAPFDDAVAGSLSGP